MAAVQVAMYVNQFHVSFTNYFNKYSFGSPSVKLTVVDLFPRAEVKFSVGNSHNHFASHDGTLDMGVPVIFTGSVMAVLAERFVGGKLFEKIIEILDQSAFGIVDIHRSGNMHRVNEA